MNTKAIELNEYMIEKLRDNDPNFETTHNLTLAAMDQRTTLFTLKRIV